MDDESRSSVDFRSLDRERAGELGEEDFMIIYFDGVISSMASRIHWF